MGQVPTAPIDMQMPGTAQTVVTVGVGIAAFVALGRLLPTALPAQSPDVRSRELGGVLQ